MAETLGVNKGDTEALDLSTVAGVLVHYAERIITETKKNLKENNSNASYQLSQSIRPNYETESTKFGIKYTAQILMEDYYEYVDLGRPAGKQPPIDVIINWMRNKEGFKLRGLEKLGDIRERGKNKRKPYTMADIYKANAFGIARKIGLKGTKPTHFFTDVVNQQFFDEFSNDLSKALKMDVEVNIQTLTDTKGHLVGGTKRF